MKSAALLLDPALVVAPVNRRIFGSFVEHLGRCVYTGIFEPGHPSADEGGFRGDVLDLVRELRISTVRYPGGNFVSGYRWEDGVGPVAQRPSRHDDAWHSTEPNTFGVDEFMAWTERANVEPMLALNLGTRGIQEAVNLLEYCNGAGNSYFADLRRKNGFAEPHNVRMWCLGNEMDGPWQIGHKTASEYGRLAAQTARAMRKIDSTLELVVCGSSSAVMPTFGAWERTVLGEAYDEVDLISAHSYFWEEDDDLASFLASAVEMDHFIESVVAEADYARAVRNSGKRVNISFDEWNVWYMHGEASKPPADDWPVAPALLEDRYSVADAVVVGSLLISLLKHSDRVAAACIAQLVNVIAPIMTEPQGRAWRQTSFHPFAQAARLSAGNVLRVQITAPAHHTARYGNVPALDAVATHDPETGALTVFAVNRLLTDDIAVTIGARGFGTLRLVGASQLSDPDPYLTVTADTADSVSPVANGNAGWDDGSLTVVVPPLSWNVIRFAAGSPPRS